MLCSAVAFGLVSCANQPQNHVDPGARERLTGGVQRIQHAVSRSDRPAAETALTALIRDVAAAQARGEVDAGSARAILEAADRVSDDVRAMEEPPGPPPIVVRVPVPRPQPPQEPSANPGGERSAVGPPADPPDAQPAPAAGQRPGHDVRPPASGNSGQNGSGQSGRGSSGQGSSGQGQGQGQSDQDGNQPGQGQNEQGQNEQGQDGQGEDD